MLAAKHLRLICLLASALWFEGAWALDLPTFYPEPGLHMFDASDPSHDLGVWPESGPIKGAQILDANGKPWDADSGLKPLGAARGKVFVGVERDGHMLALPLEHLSRFPDGKVLGHVMRTPKEGKCQAEDCDPGHEPPLKTAMKARTEIAANADVSCRPLGFESNATKLLLQFHNSVCESERSDKKAATAAEDIKALAHEWDKFIDSQPNETLKEQARLARAIDYTARTATFESDSMSNRDGIPDEKCVSEQACPRSACEMRIISLSVKNRESHQKEKNQWDRITAAARNENYYDIWKSGYTTPYITTCLLRQGIFAKGDSSSQKSLYDSVLKFRIAAQQAAKALTRKATEEFRASGTDVESAEALGRLTQYFHPPAMDGCEPQNMPNYNRTHAPVYIYRIDDEEITDVSTLNSDDWVLPLDQHKFDLVQVLVREKRKHLDYTQTNPSHTWEAPGGKGNWYVQEDHIGKVVTSNVCKRFGRPNYTNTDEDCQTRAGFAGTPPHEYYKKIPSWAFDQPSKNLPEVTCLGLKGPQGKIVSYGGVCDYKMQLVSSGEM